MECDAERISFHDSLCQITEQLTTVDIKQLKFLCLDYISIGNLEQMDSIDLMQSLHERMIIHHNNIVFLLECLILMGRIDIASQLCSDENHIKKLSQDLVKFNSRSGLSRFKIMLFDLADNITEGEVKKIILYLNGRPGISNGKIKACVTGFDLFIYLMNVRYVHPRNLMQLTNLVKQLNRLDLLAKIDIYSEINKEEGASAKQKDIDQESTPEVVGIETSQVNASTDFQNLLKGIPPEKHYSLFKDLNISSSEYKRFKHKPDILLQSCYAKQEFTAYDLEIALKKLHLTPPHSKENKQEKLEKYVMTARPRGICLIINNEVFDERYFAQRTGSDIDKRALEEVFTSFHFTVEVLNNLTAKRMESTLEDFASRDHEKYNCFVCCILSHGEENSVFGVDGYKLSYSKLTLPFKSKLCYSLSGKPKLFFIQACQGTNYQLGAEEYEMDGQSPSIIPNEADFLMAHATVRGFVSFRGKTSGSWFIQSLCNVLKNNAKRLDLMDMLLMVNNEVSQREGNLKHASQLKQVPGPLITLRKKVFFLEDSD